MGSAEVWRRGGPLMLIIAGISVLVPALFSFSGDGKSVQEFREDSLKQNVFALRHVINEYTLDQHKRPQSLGELVTAGYLKRVPADPLTRRYDAWVLESSRDPKMPGIINVHSGSRDIGSDGRAYCDW